MNVLMLVWLFSQQLFAAVWSEGSTQANCTSHAQAGCVVSTTMHMGHAMHMLSDSDANPNVQNSQEKNFQDKHKTYNNLSASCDHCRAACQPLVLNSNLTLPISTVHSLFNAQSIDSIVDTFLNTLYRPPILA